MTRDEQYLDTCPASLKISRIWAMPSHETFSIPPINALIDRYLNDKPDLFARNHRCDEIWVDPFVRNSAFKQKMKFCNDLCPEYDATHHMDALDFLRSLQSGSVDGVLFDPPYSPRQISECYQGVGRNVSTQDTQAAFWSKLKKEIGRILNIGGIAISCGWNSGGCGKSNGFTTLEILIVPHGGWHNDTIITVEEKRR